MSYHRGCRWMGCAHKFFHGQATGQAQTHAGRDSNARPGLVQILLGYQFNSFVQKGFDKLPSPSPGLKLLSLLAVLLTMGLLMWPASHHQLAENGEATKPVFSFAMCVMCWALLPFALALGVEVYIVSQTIFGTAAAAGIGAATAGVRIFLLVWNRILPAAPQAGGAGASHV